MKISLDKKKNRELMLHGNLLRAILVLAIPIVINSLIQTMYNLTDTFWLGKLGTDQLAAITLISPAQSTIINFGQGITTAGAILLSQYMGAGNKDGTASMINHLFICTLVFSIVCSTLCFIGTPSLLHWMGAADAVYTYSKDYFQLVIWDITFLFMINIYTCVNQAQGDALTPMLLNLLGVVINLILDPLFLVVLNWGTSGAALATLISKVPCAFIALYSLTKKTAPIRLNLKDFHFEKDKLSAILKIGLPTSIGKSTMQFGFVLMSKNVLAYGAIAVSAYGIGNKLSSLITTPINGMGSATSTIVGQNFGARQKERAQQTYLLTSRISVIFLLVSGILLSRPVVSQSLVGIFTQDEEVIKMGAEFLEILSLWSFANGFYYTLSGLFQGSGHTLIFVSVDAARLWFFRFLTLFFCESMLHMGVASVWYSVVVSNGLAALVLWLFYKLNLWKKDVIQLNQPSS